MSWNGWVEFAGNEIVNASRVETYAKNASWFRPVVRNASGLAALLGDDPYDNPVDDDADWTDPDIPESGDFWGCYPLDIVGLDNSTITAPIVESTVDGGTVGRPRAGTKPIVFNLALMAASEAGADYGLRWLRSALAGDPCMGGGGCAGMDLCYLPAPPCGSGPRCGSATCTDPTTRHLRRVALTTGPNVTSKRIASDDGCIVTVSFTMVASTPWEFGESFRLIHNFGDGTNPYPGGVTPTGGNWSDDNLVIRSDPDCSVPTYQPIFDPLCPNPIPPPNAPDVSLSCFNWPASFARRNFQIPEQYIPLWSSVVPIFTIKAKEEVRVMRIRFYADPADTRTADTDPCSYCGDIVFSYIPAKTTLVFDAADQRVYATTGSDTRRADSVVFGTDGKPFDWPDLSCGSPYIVTVDMPASQTAPLIDMTLVPKAV